MRMPGVRDHTELDTWQLCDEFRRQVRALIAKSGLSKDWNLRDQLRRSAEAPCPLIAEGFSRYKPRDFARFVRMAKGSLSEAIEHIGVAVDLELIAEADTIEPIRTARRARGAATGLIRYLEGAELPEGR